MAASLGDAATKHMSNAQALLTFKTLFWARLLITSMAFPHVESTVMYPAVTRPA